MLVRDHQGFDPRTTLRDVKLAVGDVAVYGNHGIGRVTARRNQEMLGKTQEVIVLELEQLTVTLPMTLARTQLRPLANKADRGRVGLARREGGAELRQLVCSAQAAERR